MFESRVCLCCKYLSAPGRGNRCAHLQSLFPVHGCPTPILAINMFISTLGHEIGEGTHTVRHVSSFKLFLLQFREPHRDFHGNVYIRLSRSLSSRLECSHKSQPRALRPSQFQMRHDPYVLGIFLLILTAVRCLGGIRVMDSRLL